MRDYKDKEGLKLLQTISDSSLSSYSAELMAMHEKGWKKILKHGDLGRWQAGFEALPELSPSKTDFSCAALQIGCAEDTEMDHQAITTALKQMHPWRKGPFNIFDVYIDTEWHSDWKWDRVKNEISPLKGRTILDVGCGSGYHLWRMLGEGAELVIGIDPTPLFSMHFATIKRYSPDASAFLLPVGIEEMPAEMACFDTVFSMGILYHRKSPIDHLIELKQLLRSGGELVIDTLVIEGDENACLIPHGRYAKMRNVWFIPSVAMLEIWLKRVGFKRVKIVDISPTTVEEQRSTDWMTFESLPDFLDPDDSNLTIEGYPAPIRAVITALA